MLKQGVTIYLISILLLLSVAPQPRQAHAAEPGALRENIRREALRKRLYDCNYWHILLHYQVVQGRLCSQVDDPSFFLSPAGKNNPKAELLATIDLLFDQDQNGAEQTRRRFPARFDWLLENLDDARGIPRAGPHSPLASGTIAAPPKQATVIFASPHVNGIGSMFGHVLLRIDSDDGEVLLAPAVNYAAKAEFSGFFSYIANGISGGYKGYYSEAPYYKKLREYQDIERRDLWEYRLNLDADEVERLLLHLVELRNIYSYYYFFSENCSSNILFLLDSARPALALSKQLAERKRPWITPLEVIRILAKAGVVSDIAFIPSLETKIGFLENACSASGRRYAQTLSERPEAYGQLEGLDRLPALEQNRMMALATLKVQSQYLQKAIDQETYRRKVTALLRDADSAPPMAVSFAKGLFAPPHRSHAPSALGLSFGSLAGSPYADLRFRPAYHDFNDPLRGATEGLGLGILDTTLRFSLNAKDLRLHRFSLLNLYSLKPDTLFSRKTSWKFSLGLEPLFLGGRREHAVFSAETGLGTTKRIFTKTLLFGLGTVKLLSGNALDESVDIGLGFEAGAVVPVNDRISTYLQIRTMYMPVHENRAACTASVSNSFTLTDNLALSLSLGLSTYGRDLAPDLRLTLNRYF